MSDIVLDKYTNFHKIWYLNVLKTTGFNFKILRLSKIMNCYYITYVDEKLRIYLYNTD